jgi:hypothetical protein
MGVRLEAWRSQLGFWNGKKLWVACAQVRADETNEAMIQMPFHVSLSLWIFSF